MQTVGVLHHLIPFLLMLSQSLVKKADLLHMMIKLRANLKNMAMDLHGSPEKTVHARPIVKLSRPRKPFIQMIGQRLMRHLEHVARFASLSLP